MIYRLTIALIVGFWLLMTGLLIRVELNPQESGVLQVPVSHVVKLMFLHQQPSNLNINEGNRPIGRLSIQPRRQPEQDQRSVEFNGSISLDLLMMPKQRFVWDGSVLLDRLLAIQELKLNLASREQSTKTHIDALPAEKRIEYQVTQGEHVVQDSKITLDEAGIASILSDLELPPDTITNLQTGFTPPTTTATQSKLKIRAESIDAYQLTVRQGQSVLADIYVSQLGQILYVKTPFGYSLCSENLMP